MSKTTTVPIGRKFESMLISAERYACGRRTYIVSDTVEYITSLLPKLSDWCISVFLEDMQSNLDMENRISSRNSTAVWGDSHSTAVWGDSQDKKCWMKFISECRSEMERRNATKEDTAKKPCTY